MTLRLTTLLLVLLTLTLPCAAQPTEFSTETFEKALALADDRPLIVEFGAVWSGPTQTMKDVWKNPKLGEWVNRRALAVRVDGDLRKDLIKRFKIKTFPTIVVLRKDQEIGRKTGAQTAGRLHDWFLELFPGTEVLPVQEKIEILSVWNSDSGGTVTLLGIKEKNHPKMVRIVTPTAQGLKKAEFPVTSGTAITWFKYGNDGFIMQANADGTDEWRIQSPDVKLYRWTKRDGQSEYPIPEFKPERKSLWSSENSTVRLAIIQDKTGIAVVVHALQKNKSWRRIGMKARWLNYPTSFEIKGGKTTPCQFTEDGKLKVGGTYYKKVK